ncbi:MAG: hypothetical protein IT385_25880 [Deltaproteobacteria bacterium]|nr:hypothetical protein [Deltaproteobacteria bacterium]
MTRVAALRRPPSSLAAVLIVVAGVSVAPACGTSCEEIRAEREAFAARPHPAHGPDARLVVPFALLDRMIARHLGARPPVEMRLPLGELGLTVRLSARLDAIHTRPAPAGRLGIEADIGLYEGAERVAEARLETAIVPTLRRATPGRPARVVIELRREHLGELSPRTTEAGRRRLAAWLRGELPPALEALATDELVGLATNELMRYFASELWPTAREQIMGREPILFASELALPGLPLSDLQVRSAGEGLALELVTDLPVDAALGASDRRARPDRLTLELTGETATELVNLGMDRGDVPARFDSRGEPRPDGRWEARVGWNRGSSSPLEVHLWQLDGECKRALVVGDLAVSMERDRLRVAVADGRVRKVRGPAFVEAFAWWEALWSDALEAVHELAAATSIELDGARLDARVIDARLADDRLTVELDVEP